MRVRVEELNSFCSNFGARDQPMMARPRQTNDRALEVHVFLREDVEALAKFIVRARRIVLSLERIRYTDIVRFQLSTTLGDHFLEIS